MSIITSKAVNGVDEVSFDNNPTAKQRYKLNGKPVVGVTTFIKAGFPTPEALTNWKIGKAAEYVWSFFGLEDRPSKEEMMKDARVAWKKDSEEAAGIGTIIHDYAYLTSLKRNEEALEMLAEHEGSPQWDQIQNCLYKVDEFHKQNKDEIVALETNVASTTYQFAGRFDRLVRRDGKVILSDYKTSKAFYLENFIQDAAYSLAISEWMEIEVQGFEVIRFGKEGGDFQQLLITDKNELSMFWAAALRCLDNYNFLKTWNKDKRFAYK